MSPISLCREIKTRPARIGPCGLVSYSASVHDLGARRFVCKLYYPVALPICADRTISVKFAQDASGFPTQSPSRQTTVSVHRPRPTGPQMRGLCLTALFLPQVVAAALPRHYVRHKRGQFKLGLTTRRVVVRLNGLQRWRTYSHVAVSWGVSQAIAVVVCPVIGTR